MPNDAVENPEKEPLVKMELGANGGDVELSSEQAIEEWIQTERSHWEWMSQTKGHAAERVKDRFTKAFEKIKNLSDEIEAQASVERVQETVRAFVGYVRKQYIPAEKPALLHSTSEAAQRLEHVREREGNQLAAQVVAFLIGIPSESQPAREWLPGALEQIAFDRGIDSHLDEKRNLEQLRDDFRSELESFRGTVNTTQKAFDERLREATKRLDALIRKYREEIKLKEAVKYWADKQEIHDKAARKWGGWSAAVLGAGILLVLLYWGITDSPSDVLIALEKTRSDVPTSVIVGSVVQSSLRFALLMLGVIWLGRIAVRNYMSNTHLSTDAAERTVVIQTYLSLIADPEIREHKEHHEQMLEHALRRIFRYAQTGIVKDDALPNVSWMSVPMKPAE